MKPGRVLLSLIIVVAVLCASTLSANAIGFEAEQVYESVFVIYSGDALGSGFAVGENCIVTNAHVIDDPHSITVATYGGAEYRASVLGRDDHLDIAVLVVENAQFPYLSMADLSAMKTGDDIYAIGAPKGMAYTLTKGTVSARERAIRGQTYIQHDAPINEGNSGGPLLNDAGQVLGMNTLKLTDSEGIGLAIPVTRVREYLTTLGIETTSGGNVVSNLPIPTEPVPTQPDPTGEADRDSGPTEDREEAPRTPAIAYIAVVVAALSLAGNVVLTVLLVHEKKKYIPPAYDPRERTDFDIDILE